MRWVGPINGLTLSQRLNRRVERMLHLHKRVASAKTNQEKIILQRQIEVTDRQIDSFVYDLYELTEEERRIVGEAVE